jgi:hypothetical protein
MTARSFRARLTANSPENIPVNDNHDGRPLPEVQEVDCVIVGLTPATVTQTDGTYDVAIAAQRKTFFM